MNLPQLIRRVEFHTNRTRSPRFDLDEHKLPAINIATHEIVQDRYDSIKRTGRKYSFETFQRIKSELRTLVVRRSLLTVISPNILVLPADYWYDLGLKVILDGREYNSDSQTFNEEKPMSENFYSRATKEDAKHLEYGNRLEAHYGGGKVVLSGGYLDYLRRFVEVSMAYPVTTLIAGMSYYVITDGTIYNGVTYNETDSFIAVTGAPNPNYGVRSYTECDLPDSLHEEVAQRAASYLNGHTGDFEKLKVNLEMADRK